MMSFRRPLIARPSARHRAGPNRPRRAAALVAVLALVGSGLSLAVAGPAMAASGQFSIGISAPASVVIATNFTEVVTVSCTTAPCTGIVITQPLPAGTTLLSPPLQSGPPPAVVASYSVSGGVVSYTLNPIATTGVSTFNVGLNASQAGSSPSTAYQLAVSSAGASNSPQSAVVATTGANPLGVAKTQSLSPVDTRDITYSLYFCTNGSTATAYPVDNGVITDVIAAGAVVTSTSNSAGTTLTHVGNTYTLSTTPGAVMPLTPNTCALGLSATITAQFPVGSFPDGTTSTNTVDASAQYLDGAPATTAPVSVTSPPFTSGPDNGPPQLVVTKTAGNPVPTNTSTDTYQLQIANRGTVRALTINEPGAGTSANFFDHYFLSGIGLGGNAILDAADVSWQINYELSGTPATVLTSATLKGTTGTPGWSTRQDACFTNAGGSANQSPSCRVTQVIPEGQYIVGWQLVLGGGVGETVPNGSVANLQEQGLDHWRSLADSSTLPASPQQTNCADGTAVDPATADSVSAPPACADTTIADRLNVKTFIDTPPTLTVGATGQQYDVRVVDADDRYLSDVCSAVLLPVGVVYSGSGVGGLTGYSTGQLPDQTAPTITSVTTSTVGTAPNTQQLVTICYSPLAPGNPGNSATTSVETNNQTVNGSSLLGYSLPISVLATAYHPPSSDDDQAAVYTSSSDPAVSGVGFTDTSGADTYGVDPYRSVVPLSADGSAILSAGGLQLAKAVSADGVTFSTNLLAAAGSTVTYQLAAVNSLPAPVSGSVICDVLPTAADGNGSQFAVTVNGPVQNVPAGAVAEYSSNAGQNCTTGTWTSNYAGATAVRVTGLSYATNTVTALTFTALVPASAVAGQRTVDTATVSGIVSGVAVGPFVSDPATVTIEPSILVRKELSGSRVVAGDQFTVAIHSGSASGPVVSDPAGATTAGAGSVVTSGTGTTGTYFADAGSTYYVTESGAGSTELGNYLNVRINCTDANGHQTGLPTNAPFTGSLAIMPVAGAAITCVLTNEANAPAYTVTKTASASSATPGQTVTYTVVVRNTGNIAYTAASPASFTDDLTSVLDDATLDPASITGGAGYRAPVLSWSGALAVGASTTVTYQVTVKDPDTGDHLLANTVLTPSGGNCPAESDDPGCSTRTPVESYTVAKAAGTSSTAPGATVTYTVTVTNTGAAAVAASFTDDLSADLDDAVYNHDVTQGATYTAPVLSWSAVVPAGATVVVRYSVTVNTSDAGDHILLNGVVTPAGAPANCPAGSTGSPCVVRTTVSTPPPATTPPARTPPVAELSTPPPATLPFTGVDSTVYLVSGGLLLAAGLMLLLLGRRRRTS